MEVRPVQERDVDHEVDDVAEGADEAELRELLPVAPLAKGPGGADAQTHRHGCVPFTHAVRETSC